MASSSSHSAPVFSSISWNYEVFLSFRGEDTRKTFVDHLYSQLVQNGINTYKDDVTLPRGESISPALLKAIEESQIAVIIFSNNYANSAWCLDELAHIIKCRDNRKQTVMPIFYDVEPTEVRKQTGKYKEAFEKQELENKEKVACWRKALEEASNISGWETKQIANGHESQGIKKIVDEISQRLKLVTSGEDGNLIGMRTRVQGLKSELLLEAGGVRMVGIWGVGGGGKTTLASFIYNEISSKYDGYCFLNNIREESSKYDGFKDLLEKMLSGILKNPQVVPSVEEGRRRIKTRLRNKKVLIVLDDVNHLDQLKMLVGSRDWFGEGSRIIFTTRDEHVLKAHGVDTICPINLLNHDEAVELFRKHASRSYTPMEDFEQLSEEVVCYAGGLPLALTVLGAFLCDKTVTQWRSTLDRLKDIPDKDIQRILRISFDALEPDHQELFLDIACFFRGKYTKKAMEKLDACGLHPVIGVEVLRQKALIVITEDGKFDMHDLVQEMGHYIVREEHPTNPEKRSRVWKRKDVCRILAMDETTELDNIEAIHLENIINEELQRFLHLAGNMNKLRWIDLRANSKISWPDKFPHMQLCYLYLHGSFPHNQLWKGYKYLPNLKHMELGESRNLIKTPDFAGLPNLQTFKIYKCPCLEEIHPSTGQVESLVFLSIWLCPRLRMFPSITRIKKLETLQFYDCKKLEIMSEDIDNLPHLNNSGKEVASRNKSASTNFLVNCWMCGLPPPAVEYCSPHNIYHRRLQFSNSALRKLDLSYCCLGDKEIGSYVWKLPNLEVLDLYYNDFSRLDFSNLRLPRLKWLNVSHCYSLLELSKLPTSIAVVIADHCYSLESFGDISNCRWLWNVSLMRAKKLDQLRADTFIHSMFQGNFSEHHFISVALGQHHLPNGLISRLFSRGKTFRMKLPDDWYNDFCGFLICTVTNLKYPRIKILMKQEDPPFDLSHESDEAMEPIYESDDGRSTCLGYVSFSSLRRTTLLTSSYNTISLTIMDIYHDDETDDESTHVGVKLIPRKSKSDEVQTTNCSGFWDHKFQDEDYVKTFKIQQCDYESSIEITWRPYNS